VVNKDGELQWSEVTKLFYCGILTEAEGLLYDAERDLLAIATLLVLNGRVLNSKALLIW